MANFSIKMIDARGWDGSAYPDSYGVSIVGIKLSEDDKFVPSNAKTCMDGAKAHGYDAVVFHFAVAPTSSQDPFEWGKAQARHFYNTWKSVDNGVKVYPAIDIEEMYSWTLEGVRAVQCYKTLVEETERLWGVAPLIYSARWYWETHITPYIGNWKPWEHNLLWEADPDPDTQEPGGWGKNTEVIVQYLLDAKIPGKSFNVDLNRVDEDWYNKTFKNVEVPPPSSNPAHITLHITGDGVEITPAEVVITLPKEA